jgi:hypothetical protein
MKALFGCLLCLVFTASQCFALRGGPPYPIGSNIVGTYAGTLQPAFCPVPDPAQCPGLNSIGVFSLGVPQTGTSTGRFIMFSRGRVFTGSITAVADRDRGSLQGVLDASFNFNIQRTELDPNGRPIVVSIPVTASANGPIDANVTGPRRNRTSTGAARLAGNATLSISGGFVNGSNGDPIITSTLPLTVTGFKQSDTVAP